MAQGNSPVFPDLGYAISRSAVVSVGFSPEHGYQYRQQHPVQQYSYENKSQSPGSSPQSQNSTYPPLTPLYRPQTIDSGAAPTMPEPSAPIRPEMKRRKTSPNASSNPPIKPQGNRRIPRVIAAAAPKAVQKSRPESANGYYGMQAGVPQGLHRNDPRMMKGWNDEFMQKTGEKEATVFGYVFDGTS